LFFVSLLYHRDHRLPKPLSYLHQFTLLYFFCQDQFQVVKLNLQAEKITLRGFEDNEGLLPFCGSMQRKLVYQNNISGYFMLFGTKKLHQNTQVNNLLDSHKYLFASVSSIPTKPLVLVFIEEIILHLISWMDETLCITALKLKYFN
jgi:hypothetical protein